MIKFPYKKYQSNCNRIMIIKQKETKKYVNSTFKNNQLIDVKNKSIQDGA